VLYGVDRSTITRAVHEMRPLLAKQGFAVPQRPGTRLRTLADVFACAAAEGVELRIDGTEVRSAVVDGRDPAGADARRQRAAHRGDRGSPAPPPRRICVEHAIAEPKQWRPLQRRTGRRDSFEETFQAVAGLVSDRTAKR
jgi:hypothetical protein